MPDKNLPTLETLGRIALILGVEMDNPGKGRLDIALRDAHELIESLRQEIDTGDDTRQAEVEGMEAADFERAAYGIDDGTCTQDDEFDSRGQPLRPRVNDAGEPWWM